MIQKQFNVEANLFRNLKALAYSESCPLICLICQYIEKGQNCPLLQTTNILGGKEKYLEDNMKQQKQGTKIGKFRFFFVK